MSTEKLSELSKPVFEIEVSGGHWLNCTSGKLTPDAGADFSDWPDGVNRLYSQEYVSALLAELEDERASREQWQQNCTRAEERISELEAIRADASQVFKEIGNELGCNPDNESIMIAIDELKEREKRVVALAGGNADLWETMAARLEAAEAKLATPVQLPKPCAFNLCDLVDRDAVIASLREQGFTVEGDE